MSDQEGPEATRILEDPAHAEDERLPSFDANLTSLIKPGLETISTLPSTISTCLNNLISYKSAFQDPFTLDSPRASVLLGLAIRQNTLQVLLTKRSAHLSSHSGEVALPGGKRDEEDATPWDTAIREAHEEVGLPPNVVTYLNQMPPLVSRNQLLVTPVIAWIPSDFDPIPNPSEVDSCFWMPLSTFLETDIHHHQDIVWGQGPHRMHSFLYEGYNVFGLTAGICITVAQIAFAKPPSFERHAPGEKRDFSRYHELTKAGRFHLLQDAKIPDYKL